ncbi:MAG: hypothetical protein ABSG57_09405 [Candidatus Bathyarchaeia archaeon]
MSKESAVSNPEDVRFRNIIGMGLDFSSMIRLFKKNSETKLEKKIVEDYGPRIFKAQSGEEFNKIHKEFCKCGTRAIKLAEKRTRNGRIIKEGPATYGQIAKTFNIALKVIVYYCHLPDHQKSAEIVEWLHAGVDTRMMAMLKKRLKGKHPEYFEDWPEAVKDVDSEKKYLELQEVVRIFIREKHDEKLRLPVHFDDVYWYRITQGLEKGC